MSQHTDHGAEESQSAADAPTRFTRSIMSALLRDGIPAILGTSPGDAEAWLRADDPAWPFSFRNACEALGLDPEVLRAVLLTRPSYGGPRAGRMRSGRSPGGPHQASPLRDRCSLGLTIVPHARARSE